MSIVKVGISNEKSANRRVLLEDTPVGTFIKADLGGIWVVVHSRSGDRALIQLDNMWVTNRKLISTNIGDIGDIKGEIIAPGTIITLEVPDLNA